MLNVSLICRYSNMHCSQLCEGLDICLWKRVSAGLLFVNYWGMVEGASMTPRCSIGVTWIWFITHSGLRWMAQVGSCAGRAYSHEARALALLSAFS